MRFLTANYLFPIHEAPVANGILVIKEDGSIVDLINPEGIDYEISNLEKFAGFLCPGFVNAHCHLELSWAKDLIQPGQGLDSFLKELEGLRKTIQPKEELQCIEREGEAMLKSGIVAVADVVNGLTTLTYKEHSQLLFYTFAEVFASNPAKADLAFNNVSQLYNSFRSITRNKRASITPHSTYSLSSDLFQLVARHAVTQSSLISIHHQESEDENSYFLDGSGRIALRRILFNPGIAPFEPTGLRPIESIAGFFSQYQPFLLVHNTVSEEADILYAEDYFNNLFWCLCPNANLFIENKLPDIRLLRKTGCKLTIGTDSLASNQSLSLLEEIKTIQSHCPEIPLCELLAWATQNGADALGFNQLGSFETGKNPGIVLIENPDTEQLVLLPGSTSRLLQMHGYDSLH